MSSSASLPEKWYFDSTGGGGGGGCHDLGGWRTLLKSHSSSSSSSGLYKVDSSLSSLFEDRVVYLSGVDVNPACEAGSGQGSFAASSSSSWQAHSYHYLPSSLFVAIAKSALAVRSLSLGGGGGGGGAGDEDAAADTGKTLGDTPHSSHLPGFEDAPLAFFIPKPLDAATMTLIRKVIRKRHNRTKSVRFLMGYGEAAHGSLSDEATPLGTEAMDEVVHAFRSALREDATNQNHKNENDTDKDMDDEDSVQIEAAYLPMAVSLCADGDVPIVWHPHLSAAAFAGVPPAASTTKDDDTAVRGHALACLLDQLRVRAEFFAVTTSDKEDDDENNNDDDDDDDDARRVALAAATAVCTAPSRRRAGGLGPSSDEKLPRCAVLVVDRRSDVVTPLACAAWSALDRTDGGGEIAAAAPAPAACTLDETIATTSVELATAVAAAAAGRSAASAPFAARSAIRSQLPGMPRGENADASLVDATAAALAPDADAAARDMCLKSPIASRLGLATGKGAGRHDWAWFEVASADLVQTASEGFWPSGGAHAVAANALSEMCEHVQARIVPAALLTMLAFALDVHATSRRDSFGRVVDGDSMSRKEEAEASLRDALHEHGASLERAVIASGIPLVDVSDADDASSRLLSLLAGLRLYSARGADPLPHHGVGGGAACTGDVFPCRHRSLVRTLVAYACAPTSDASSSALAGTSVRVTHVPRGDAAGFAGATLRQGLGLGLKSLLNAAAAARPLSSAPTVDLGLSNDPHPRTFDVVLVWFVHGGPTFAESTEGELVSFDIRENFSTAVPSIAVGGEHSPLRDWKLVTTNM
ncbi:hypothetical protein PPROV_000551900 [Pycnococcus provasolii]|uniref:Uncharacterized protein n=2 Tax=Pycnococcus provasolii TaxID=41880 RepID=A0A830HJ49_9CHLO|nr:hypothetical protein PPROV_000551900 [Pycnococcus provasolii]